MICSSNDVAFPIPEDFSLSYLGNPVVHVVGSSNGYLLSSHEQECPMSYVISSPITKQQIILPIPNKTSKIVCHGFQCDAYGKHYKIVRTISLRPLALNTGLTVEVLSSDMPNQWKLFILTCPFRFSLNFSFRSTTMIRNDVAYLPAFVEQATLEPCLLIFDQSKEILEVVEVPKERCNLFGMSDGLILCASNELGQLKIWLLNDKGDAKREWFLKHNVGLGSKVENYFECTKDADEGIIELIAFHPMNPRVLFIACAQNIYQYNVSDSRFELICDFTKKDWNRVYTFIPYTSPLIGPQLFCDH
ncbi:hypothetical protein AQUCO_00700234v1 [Aquilegia coerulea]|nr:hypothetical protein AQUCO_00700234v1 [Aquilegia coerulea]